MSAEIENGYFTGYGSLHGANNRVGGFQLSGSHMKTCKDNVEKHVFDITYTWNDIMDPNWEYLSDLFLADLFSTFVSPKDYEIKIQWAKITTILISDK